MKMGWGALGRAKRSGTGKCGKAGSSPYGVDFVVCSGDYSRKRVFLKGEELK